MIIAVSLGPVTDDNVVAILEAANRLRGTVTGTFPSLSAWFDVPAGSAPNAPVDALNAALARTGAKAVRIISNASALDISLRREYHDEG